MLALLLCLLVEAVHSQITCEAGWTEYNNNCYKHFDTPNERLTLPTIRSKCQSFGGDIATAATKGERQFMETMNRPSFNGKFIFWDPWGDQMLVGIYQDIYNNWASIDPNESIEPIPWCGTDVQQDEPNQYLGKEHCVTHHTYESNAFCYQDIQCQGEGTVLGFRRYMCKKPKGPRDQPKPIVCRDKNAEIRDGRCVCKDGYEDISDSDALDSKTYKQGEKCVIKDPCSSLQTSLSMIFIVDSSQSIEAQNWPSLVNFLKSGNRLIPNRVNVGFIKFATEVTYAEWLPAGWTSGEFQQIVPTEFDAGYTNTPAALNKAIEMFENNRSRKKVAILISDGLPVVDEQTPKETALANTDDAAARLRQTGIDLVVLGFGPDLVKQNGYSYIRKWLQDPREDYFSFDKYACDLRSIHMQILLEKVCRRYL